MKTLRTTLILVTLALLASCGSPKREGAIGDWQVMTAPLKKGKTLCYAGSSPVASNSVIKKRGQPYLMATRRTSGKIEISASAGYPYKTGSKPELVINGKPRALFFKGDVAWAKGDQDDKEIIEALKTAQLVELRATSQKGETSTDRYSADGFAASVARIRKLCP